MNALKKPNELKPGDVILDFEGKPFATIKTVAIKVETVSVLVNRIDRSRIWRTTWEDGEEIEVEVPE